MEIITTIIDFINEIGFIGIGYYSSLFVEWSSDIFSFCKNKGDYRKFENVGFEENIYVYDCSSGREIDDSKDICSGFECIGDIDF